jgi:hypothetical protein
MLQYVALRSALLRGTCCVILCLHASAQKNAHAHPLQLFVKLQIFPGDVFTWRCTYNASGSLAGGYSSSKGSQQEQCTMMLHYWPRVESMRGCLAATLSDQLLGENMCSHEAEDMLRITAAEEVQFPIG